MIDKLKEYNNLSLHHYQRKYEHLRIIKELKATNGDKKIIKYHREQSKIEDGLVRKYDKLSSECLTEEVLLEMYDREITQTTTRASRCVRYHHYSSWNTATIEERERWGIELLKLSLRKSTKPVVSCSFGIDSIVTLHMTRKALKELGREPSEIQVIWNDTLNEFPDVKKYARELTKEWNINLLVTKPKKPLKKVIDDYGGMDESYFGRKGDRSKDKQPLSEKCCGVLKHEPMKRAIRENNWDLIINGLRSDESNQRLKAGLRDGEYFYSTAEWKAFVCRPIMWMREEDVWEYVAKENIPYNALYEKNMIKVYPNNHSDIAKENKEQLIKLNIDYDKFLNEELLFFSKTQALLLEKLGYSMYTPRTGCMQCSIPIKYGYLQWMRLTYPKIFTSMIYTLGYGKILLGMIPEDVKKEIHMVTGIDLTEENAHEYLEDILKAKPCTFDSFD